MPWYTCKMSGQDPEDAWQGIVQFTDSRVLLCIDLIVTAAHLGLPIRWIIMVPLEVAGAALYAACVAIGSPEDAAFYNLAMLVGLIAAAAIGKRSIELHERQTFAQLAQERVLRCDAEFQLSQLQGAQPARRGPESEPEGSMTSAPTTTNTGKVFELEEGTDVQGQFQAMRDLGHEEHWLLAEHEVDLLPDRVLGRGGFGLVLTGLFCGTPVAVKLVLERHGDSAMRRVNALANELRILRQLRHPNIVLIHGAVVDAERQRVALVLELVQGQTVTSFVGLGPRGQNLTELCGRYQVCLGMCRAFLYLHSRKPPIVHGDLKSANVLVVGSGRGAQPKLLDFGLSRVLTRHVQPLGGTLSWMAPEVFRRDAQRPRCSADIFSFGMLLHYVATRVHTREGMNRSLIKQVLRTAQPVSLHWPPDSAFQPHCKPLVESCLQVDEHSRPTAAEVHNAISSWPSLGTSPALPCDEAIALDPSRAKRWDKGVRCLAGPRFRAPLPGNAERPCGNARGEEPPPAAPQQPFSPLQRPDRLETVEEERTPWPLGRPTAARPRAPRRLLVPGLRPTEERMMLRTVVHACCQWNYELPTDCCCGFHAGVAILQQFCTALARTSCESDFGHTGSWRQCPRCGLLTGDDAASSSAGLCWLCAEEAESATPCPAVAGPRREQL